jgi:hypothetical protein
MNEVQNRLSNIRQETEIPQNLEHSSFGCTTLPRINTNARCFCRVQVCQNFRAKSKVSYLHMGVEVPQMERAVCSDQKIFTTS